MSHDSELQDDNSHPIPSVDLCDVHGERKDGGHDLVIVIASPVEADRRSQKRLVEKLRKYLTAIEALRGRGAGDCRVLVKAHRDSDEAIFELLERSRIWIEQAHISLEVTKIP